MTLEIIPFVLGALGNNTYLLGDSDSANAVVIDPSFDIQPVADEITRSGWFLSAIWLTHAHFDHIAGVSDLLHALGSAAPVALHPADLPLYQNGGGARLFGFSLGKLPEPAVRLEHGKLLCIGENNLQVRHTPGHTSGHVIFYSAAEECALCGDLIFYHGIGRTDLPGGNYAELERSILTQVYTLPPATRLLSGHGDETTVGEEMKHNPYVQG